MRSWSHINTAKQIIQSYQGEIPLASWLKQFFKTEKKFGSSDRRQISHICFCHYRTGNSLNHLDTDTRLIAAVFVCSTAPNKLLEELKPEWNEQVQLPLTEKLHQVNGDAGALFSWKDALSHQIDAEAFSRSLLIQPDLFLRLRPGALHKVPAQLEAAGIGYRLVTNTCLALASQTPLENLVHLDRDAVVQDASSQRTLEPLPTVSLPGKNMQVWDCCAASGGKSILCHDLYPGSQLTVSDVRESILLNLRNRFKRAGINNYRHFLADVSSEGFHPKGLFDLVICDAPCSGSGTWSRTPEQLVFFAAEKIDHYAGLQKSIAVNASKGVKPGGFFLYITCSVFARENEEVVRHIQTSTKLELLSTNYPTGYEHKADTLFTALFRQL